MRERLAVVADSRDYGSPLLSILKSLFNVLHLLLEKNIFTRGHYIVLVVHIIKCGFS